MRPFSRRFAELALVLAILFLGVQPILANWVSDYNKGKKYYKKDDWNSALPYFLKALEDKPEDCADCIREGMHFYDYIPNYYVAECYFRIGELQPARNYFHKAMAMGVVQKKPGFWETLRDRLEEIKKPEPTPPAQAQEKPPAAQPQVTAAPETQSGPDPQLRQRVLNRLDEVQESIRDGERRVGNRPGLRKILNESRQKLTTLRTDLEIAEDNVQVLTVDQEISKMVSRLQELKDRLERETEPSTGREGSRVPPEQTKPPAPETGREREPESGRDTREGLNALRAGFEAFFSGDLARAESNLERARSKDIESCYLQVLQGCILATRHFLEQPDDETTLNRAKEAFAEARNMGCGEDVLTSNDFSPKLVRLYSEKP